MSRFEFLISLYFIVYLLFGVLGFSYLVFADTVILDTIVDEEGGDGNYACGHTTEPSVAQRFQLTENTTSTQMRVKLRIGGGTPEIDPTLSIRESLGGEILASTTISHNDIFADFSEQIAVFEVGLLADTTYYAEIECGSNSNDYYEYFSKTPSTYADGELWVQTATPSWVEISNRDGKLIIYSQEAAPPPPAASSLTNTTFVMLLLAVVISIFVIQWLAEIISNLLKKVSPYKWWKKL